MVLNYNGRRHLDDCFSTLLVAATRSRHDCRVVCVDNRSTEPDVAYVRERFPEVEVVIAERNDFLFSLNEVAARRSEDVVIILNNDMRVERGFIRPLLAHFANPDVFAVSAKVYDWDGTTNTTGRRWLRYSGTYVRFGFDRTSDEACYTLDGGGGCAAFRRRPFVDLGGFDPLYRPGYVEDVDLSYAAWAQGWTVIYEPRSIIYHRCGATMWDHAREGRMVRLLTRNTVLFTVKNVGNARFFAEYLLRLPYRIAYGYLIGDPDVARGMLAALARLPRAILRRLQRPRPRRQVESIATIIDGALGSGGPAVAARRTESANATLRR